MANTILGALAPVFGLILLGVFLGKIDLLGEHGFEVLNRFVIAVTMPVLTFVTLAKAEPGDLAVAPMIAAVLGGAFSVYALGSLVERATGRSAAEANIAGLAACFSNTGFVGLPVALLTFGPVILGPVAVAMALYAAVVFGAGVLLSELTSDRTRGLGAGLRSAVHAIIRSPLIVLSALGVAWSILGLPLSGPFETLLGTLAAATAPCALVAIGLFIAMPRAEAQPGPIARVICLKLAIHPLVTFGLVLLLPPMPPLWGTIAVLMAAMPSGATSFVLAGRAGRWAMEVSAWSVTLTTTFAAASLVAVLWLLQA